MLKVSKLKKSFEKTKAVRGVSFEIKPGEIHALIGPNGAGKTTVLKLVAGLYKKDGGKINFLEEDISEDEAKVRGNIGYIPDEPLFYAYLKAEEFLDFVRQIYQIPEKEYKKRLEKLLEIYPIGNILSEYPSSFSRGNKQKLSIIAAMIHNPKLLIVDEPIVGLDPQSVNNTEKLYKDFAEDKGMILVSTHTLSFVSKLATKIGIIDEGKIIYEGTASQITKKAKGKDLVSAFIKMTSHD